MEDHAHSSSLAVGSVPSLGASLGEEADNETDDESLVRVVIHLHISVTLLETFYEIIYVIMLQLQLAGSTGGHHASTMSTVRPPASNRSRHRLHQKGSYLPKLPTLPPIGKIRKKSQRVLIISPPLPV